MPGQGLWGLVDQRAVRAWEATGRTDARLVAAIREVPDAETHASTGTRFRLIRRVVGKVEERVDDVLVALVAALQPVKALGRAWVRSMCQRCPA